MLKSTRFLICALIALLLAGCGGGGSEQSSSTGTDSLRGVWTATLDSRAQRELVADLSVSEGQITGFLRLTDGAEILSCDVTGTQSGENVQFSGNFAPGRQFVFTSESPIAVGQELQGSFSLANERGEVRFHHDGDERHNVAGAWAGTWTSTVDDHLGGEWRANFTQSGHQLEGHGTLLQDGHEYTLNLSGSIVGRFVALAAASGERPSLWRGHVVKSTEGFGLEGRYVGRMVPGDALDEGTLNGSSGVQHRLEIRPGEMTLPPLAIETLHASLSGIDWTQRSEEAQPGEFVDQTENSVRFRAPLIGGHIEVRGTVRSNPEVFGICRVLVTGATGTVGGTQFRTVQGIAANVVSHDRTLLVVEIPTEHGAIRLQTPWTESLARFELVPEQTTVALRTPEALFRANGQNETRGVIEYTRLSTRRVSGRFEAVMRKVEHPESVLTVSGNFDVPFSAEH